jgi:ADP-dependent NAD(P)H-hydrate dehydratase
MSKGIEEIKRVPPLPPRPDDGHKGTFGRVLIVGGNVDMIGAPTLASTAALRMGSGLVQIAVPRAVLAACLSITPELVGLGLEGKSHTALLEAAAKATALVVGPGLGDDPLARARLLLLTHIEKPMVLDADALNMLSTAKRWPAKFLAKAVLTPHPGEMSRLGRLIGQTKVPSDDAGRIALAQNAARAFNQIVVLKGHRTVVTDGRRVYINTTGDATLAKAGTGDVLSGMIGSLLGQGMDRFDAAVLGVYLHGLSGEIAGARIGQRSALAREIIDSIPQAVAQLKGGARGPTA